MPGNNTNQDINASEKIWEFFQKYDLNGLISVNSDFLEHKSPEKKLIRVVDFLGRNNVNTNLYIEIFQDGSFNKKLIVK